ncbi:MAG: transglutaminase domain-containing protein, partial [Christensenellales bacterium]
MNKDLNLKKFQFVLVAFAMIVVGMFMSFLPMQSVFAESEEAYYYSKLNDNLSKKFYNAICKMEEQNLLASGISEFNLIDNKILTQAEINQYLSGNSEVLKSFGAGRDAYVLDYAGNFYTDFSKLSLSIGTKNGKYIATLGTGRADNYYIDENLTNNLVADKKVALSDKVSSLLGDYSDLSVLQQIELANQIVINNVSYNFCNDIDKQEFAPYIRTAYGALCNGYAVCEGYARALKVLLDEMGINNILVYGYLLSNQGAYEEHMWNYVEIEHKWYAIDSTLNDSMGEKSYYLKGADEFNYDHLANGVISEANYEFTYPVLNTYNYGEESLPTVIEYNDVGDTKFLYVTTSYNNKNATDLASEGLYLSYNYSTQTSTENAITWTQWFAMSVVMSFEDFKESFEETSTATTMKDYGSSPFIKFALIKGAPTGLLGRYENVANDDIVCQSDIITNEAYDGYVAAPFAYKVTPANTAKLDINKTYDITLKYDEQLIKTDDLEVGVSVTSTHEATSDDYSLTNIQWNENTNELSFQFKPSKKFIHNGDGYCFTPTNLVGQDSGKTPHAVSYSFQYTSIVCNKILDGGRLYMDVVGHPRLIDNSDLSMSNWDLNGEPVCQNQRSQIALVVTNTSEEDKDDMIASAVETTSGINQNDVLSSSTYE